LLLHYMRARYYKPDTKRFISLDALHGDILNPQALNRYAYVLGNPVMGVDPSGKKAKQIVAVTIGAIVSLVSYEIIRDPDEKNTNERLGAALGGGAAGLFASSPQVSKQVGKKVFGFTIKKGTRRFLNAALIGCESSFIASSIDKLISIGLNPVSKFSTNDAYEMGESIGVGCLTGPLMRKIKMGIFKVENQKIYNNSVKDVVGNYASTVLTDLISNSRMHLSNSQ